MIAWYIFLLMLLEITIFVRGNAKFVWGLELHPLEWWLYVGWFSIYFMLSSVGPTGFFRLDSVNFLQDSKYSLAFED
mgnify:CR=1 FL=1